MYYTQEQIDRANQADLVSFLQSQGEQLTRAGNEYRWKRHDSLTVRGNKWYRHSQSKGGAPIDFVMEFFGKSFTEAVELLTGEKGAAPPPDSPAPLSDFRLPPRSPTAEQVKRYLTEARRIDEDVTGFFISSGDIYEEAAHHNAVFVGRDEDGIPRYAHSKGTAGTFRLDVKGSDKAFNFCYRGEGERLFVFEAPIDLLSFLCLFKKEWQKQSYLALGGVGEKALLRFLSDRPNIKTVYLCLDSDQAGNDACSRLVELNVYRKLQGHWIIEMSEMIATANAKSIEDIKSFLSRQKETYKAPYEVHPKDHKRQCVFAGTSNTLDFLPLDRTGNRRFLPVQVQAEAAEVHILEDEAASRAYIGQMWAEVMEVYRKGDVKLKLSPAMERYLKEHQRSFMPEDTLATRILNFLDGYGGKMVCSLQIYHEGLGHPDYEEPKQYDIRDINSIMKNYAAGWKAFENPRHFPPPYNRQKGWERAEPPDNGGHGKSGFQPLPEGEAVQLGLPEEWLEGEKP